MALAVVWFKRDLRCSDHAPLHAAAASGRPLLPLYLVEPDLWAQADASARHWRLFSEALSELRAELAALGAPLWVLQAEAGTAFDALHRAFGLAEVHAHEETGNAWTYARDRRVAGLLRERGVAFIEHPNGSTVRRLARREAWLVQWERHKDAAALPLPEALQGFDGAAQSSKTGTCGDEVAARAWLADARRERLPDGRELGLADDPCPGRQPGGRASALRLLSSFIDGRGAHYSRGMSSPISAAKVCSRLSVHFASGTLSIREAVAATRAAASTGCATPVRALQSFESRLHWQGHFMQKLESEPAIEFRNTHRGFDGLREAFFDRSAFEAWRSGCTGWPFVDACMRRLAATGWINFRMRAMLVAVASYHLWLHWRETGLHLARQFTDYEPGIHWPQVQMQSGVTGINIPRIYNPVKQGLDQDPEGAFVRRWVPELAALPAPWIHLPWKLPAAQLARHGVVLGRDYPAPLCDHEQAARAAKARLTAWWREHPGMREGARAVLARHGSRQKQARPRLHGPAKKNPAPLGATQGDLFR
ncbi:FAD-binding domain-containing protein [Silanimonas sp.]|uniref:FAD-binding domain-containing protein n=1 Tax=Silanimonas sp. TaxID=1929290 RepID=UPI001BC47AC4|nr:FAD-binding domain-containing protein [Silanimonas sp.]MBS3895321.1 deoxyribodipyrimidine photo-lyase/cryptochrome family protein [Silanimonas sp.]MBS3923697.1 deoxyribodipyrimidine photo-lyase/cryptochrome family protein [Xanthomonadaceae bacterium]